VAVLALSVVVGVARWFTTSYRIDADPESGQVQLRAGLLHRKVISVPRNRIRSVQTDARLLHRLLGLAVLRVSTGQEARAEHGFELNAVRVDEVPRLRAILLAESSQPVEATTAEPVASSTVLARWQPSWLRYAPLSLSGLLTMAAAAGVVYQSGAFGPLQHSRLVKSWLDAAERLGVAGTVAVIAAVVLTRSHHNENNTASNTPTTSKTTSETTAESTETPTTTLTTASSQPPVIAGAKWVVIVYSGATGAFGWANGASTKDDASNTAMNFCKQYGGTDCKLAAWAVDECAALARSDTSWHGGTGPTIDAAEKDAISENKGGTIVVSKCSTG